MHVQLQRDSRTGPGHTGVSAGSGTPQRPTRRAGGGGEEPRARRGQKMDDSDVFDLKSLSMDCSKEKPRTHIPTRTCEQQLHILPPRSSITTEHQGQHYSKVMVWFLLLFYLLGVAANQKEAVLRPDIQGSLQFEVSDISTAECLHRDRFQGVKLLLPFKGATNGNRCNTAHSHA